MFYIVLCYLLINNNDDEFDRKSESVYFYLVTDEFAQFVDKPTKNIDQALLNRQ
jgi:hypothetical protein